MSKLFDEEKSLDEIPEAERVVVEWLRARQDSLQPAPAFARASRPRLVAQIRRQDPLRTWWGELWQNLGFQHVAYLFTLAVLVITIYGFQARLAPLTQQALPGDLTYPLKLSREEFQVLLTRDEEARAHLFVDLARQRSHELESLMLESRIDNLEVAALRLSQAVERAEFHLAVSRDLSNVDRQALSEELADILDGQRLVLSVLIDTLPFDSRYGVQPVLAMVNR